MPLVYTYCEFSRSITDQFVAPAGELSHVIQRLRCCQLLESKGDAFRAIPPPPALELALVGQLALKPFGREEDFHRPPDGQWVWASAAVYRVEDFDGCNR